MTPLPPCPDCSRRGPSSTSTDRTRHPAARPPSREHASSPPVAPAHASRSCVTFEKGLKVPLVETHQVVGKRTAAIDDDDLAADSVHQAAAQAEDRTRDFIHRYELAFEVDLLGEVQEIVADRRLQRLGANQTGADDVDADTLIVEPVVHVTA